MTTANFVPMMVDFRNSILITLIAAFWIHLLFVQTFVPRDYEKGLVLQSLIGNDTGTFLRVDFVELS